MPSKKIMYECKYCGKEYSDYDECKEHEETHVLNFDNVDTKEIVQRLRELGESAYGYHVGNRVLGIPAKNFENLMTEAARRLEEQDKVVEQLKSVSYERYGNDGGMGGEHVVNLDDAIEIMKGCGVNV